MIRGEGETVYTVLVTQLNNHFLPKVNKTYERSLFRAMSQSQSETVDQFITHLRQRAFYEGHPISSDNGLVSQKLLL